MPPRTDWAETIGPDEPTRFAAFAQRLAGLHGTPRTPDRTLHAKGHVGARARVEVLPDLPEPCRVGIFAAPGHYDAWVRWSNGGHRRQRDATGDLRGFALKVLDVPGKKLIPGMEDARTQDFLLINTPTLPFPTTEAFVTFVEAAQSPATLPFRLIYALGFGPAFSLIRGVAAMVSRPFPSAATARYWSVGAVRWGDYAARVSVLPVSAPEGAAGSGRDHLRDDLLARLAAGPVVFDLAVQLYADPARTPIEDLTVEWPEADAPTTRVARIEILQQDLRGDAGAAQGAYVETLSFDPWHAPVEFRPLGEAMRARSEAYRVSTMGRGAAPEPAGMVDAHAGR